MVKDPTNKRCKTDQGKIFTMYILNKGLLSQIDGEFLIDL